MASLHSTHSIHHAILAQEASKKKVVCIYIELGTGIIVMGRKGAQQCNIHK